MPNWFSDVLYLNWYLLVEILYQLKLLKKIVFKNIFGIWVSQLFLIFFWLSCRLDAVEAGHNLFLVINNLINNCFFNQLFLGFVTTVTTEFHNMLEICINLHILKDWSSF